LALVRTIATRQLVIAVSAAARGSGIRPGMTLGESRALCSTLEHEEHDPSRDQQSLEALARWMMRFSPVVALPGSNLPGPPAQMPDAQGHGIFLDLTGCERTFHGLDNVLRRIRGTLSMMCISANLAIAPTPGAAWALTFHPQSGSTCGSTTGEASCQAAIDEPLRRRLKELPPAALRLDDETIRGLHHLGLVTIGKIMDLPRDQLPARFGSLLSRRIDQAIGKIPEPLLPLEPHVVIRAHIEFDGPVESLEDIWIGFRHLIGQVIGQLLRHGRGAREIELKFYRAYATTLRTTIRLSRPSRDPVNLFNLMRCAMETIQTEEGFLGIALHVTSSERISDRQIHLLGGEEHAARAELDHLIERLRVRLGEVAVSQPELVESHVPEHAYVSHGRLEPAPAAAASTGSKRSGPELRPLHLLRRPVELRVMVSPSHDRDGRPISFTHQGEVHRLAHAVGPERIAGQWWQGHFKTRDYFDVEDGEGKRFWIFRVTENGKWFLHGAFD
jgi:protein ImuB